MELQRENLLDFGVGSVDDWFAYSDHMPIWLDVNSSAAAELSSYSERKSDRQSLYVGRHA